MRQTAYANRLAASRAASKVMHVHSKGITNKAKREGHGPQSIYSMKRTQQRS